MSQKGQPGRERSYEIQAQPDSGIKPGVWLSGSAEAGAPRMRHRARCYPGLRPPSRVHLPRVALTSPWATAASRAT